MTNFIPNSFMYFFNSQKIITENEVKNNKNIIRDNFEKFIIKTSAKKIKKVGISDRILLILVFLGVKTFKP